ncbi:hypothetical protein KAI87_12070, partial [Myxococcota bacterium]|nr:hypothetical protein [Myxococcota bacterium]
SADCSSARGGSMSDQTTCDQMGFGSQRQKCGAVLWCCKKQCRNTTGFRKRGMTAPNDPALLKYQSCVGQCGKKAGFGGLK